MAKIVYNTIVVIVKGIEREIKTIMGIEKETEKLESLAQLKKKGE